MGMHEAETVASLKVSKTSLPDETKLVVLDYQRE